MKSTSQPPRRLGAFTLIELLTVIAIIAILMGLLFPALGIIKEQARKVQAKTDVMNIVSSVKNYFTEYGKYPPVQDSTGSASGDVVVGDPVISPTADNSALFNTLRAIPDGINANHKYNPRKIPFFEGKSAADSASPRAGFADKSGSSAKGSFFDPWGKQYNIAIDADYDNVLRLDQQYTDFGGDNAPRVGTGAFALGKDNKLGDNDNKQYKKGSTLSDDVISWQ